MANLKYLKILKQGVAAWNKWRDNNTDKVSDLIADGFCGVDFRGEDFSRANFDGVNFARSDFDGAKLEGTTFREANLIKTNFRVANLTNADLTKANLIRSNLNNAYLSDATFREAFLADVNFTGAYFRGTIFNKALLGHTIFASNNLREVKGLNSVRHIRSSSIDIETIYLSDGDIPEVFLRGCGVPDEFITYTRSLANAVQPIQYYSCFISYSSKDQSFAERLYVDLQNNGVRCWFASEDLKIGDKIRDRIDESIRLRDKLLLILSENSIASDWVEHEVESALDEERQSNRIILFPVRIDNSVMESNKAWAALIRRTRHIGDFRYWKQHDEYQKALHKLLRDLKSQVASNSGAKEEENKLDAR
ncbi:MAG TPA: toll/interleukin-1 receptor domain-containing protein [Pyrinomonadaceae bacterium]|jgi:hypothetical protein